MDPYAHELLDNASSLRRPVVRYTQAQPPPRPALTDLPLTNRLSQYGITWTFTTPARVGQFVNGDWYVVGPVTVQHLDPRPLYGPEIPEEELDARDRERPVAQRIRHGFMVNPPAAMKVAYDSGVRNWFDPALIQRLPAPLRPGEALVATISMPKGLVQVGIDLGGMIRAGHPGWTGWGGHGSGRKLPIVLAGLLLEDHELANINRSFPRASFGEDEQTAYGPAWTGATVVFAGHSGIDAVTGLGRSRGNDWGPYEHLHPAQWQTGQHTSESYRRCCTSVGWVAQALALRLLGAEAVWGHDAFFDYVDRWMHEDDAVFVKTIREATGRDHDQEWARQGQAWDAFVNEMWARHRPRLPAGANGWQETHDEGRYQRAIAQ